MQLANLNPVHTIAVFGTASELQQMLQLGVRITAGANGKIGKTGNQITLALLQL
jgi:hypothetical protein